MDGVRPSAFMFMGGGLVLFISTFLDWFDGVVGFNGWETDAYGLQGIFVAVIGLLVGGGVAVTTFANVDLPDDVVGFTRTQVFLALGLAAFLITFGLQFGNNPGIGVLLGWISAAVIVAAGVMDTMGVGAGSSSSAPPASPPQQPPGPSQF